MEVKREYQDKTNSYITHNKHLKLLIARDRTFNMSHDCGFNNLKILSGLVKQLQGLPDCFVEPAVSKILVTADTYM